MNQPGSNVLLTGASSGIGRALAVQLAGGGANLALAARDGQRLDAVAQACRHFGSLAISIPTDVADEHQCRALIEQSAGDFQRLDMLINCAGVGMVS